MLTQLLKGGEWGIERNYYIKFYVWDIIPLDAITSNLEYKVPYNERLTMLSDAIDKSRNHVELIDTEVVHSYEEAQEHFRQMSVRGYEGTIIKDPHAPWKDGTSKWQVKLKSEKICDLRVIGWIKGNGRLEDTFGSLTCESEEGDIVVNVSGFTDKERERITDEDYWNGRIISVKFNEVIDDKNTGELSLFLPRYDELREELVVADTADRIVLM